MARNSSQPYILESIEYYHNNTTLLKQVTIEKTWHIWQMKCNLMYFPNKDSGYFQFENILSNSSTHCTNRVIHNNVAVS